MRRIPLTAFAAAALLMAAASTHADAQSAPQRVRGTISQVSTDTIVVHTADDKDQTLTLAPDVRIGSDRALAISDIKTGDYIGTAADKQPDGSLVAVEVTVFPEAFRGRGEGQRPWSGGANSTMTNANVDEVVTGTSGNTLKLSFTGGSAAVVVPPGTPIVTPVPGDRTLLVPGKAVSAFVRQESDGTLTAVALTVEKDGVTPP